MSAETCVCGSGLSGTDCCLPYLSGERHATSAEALMRSRYSAYVHRHEAYLLATWHPSTRPTSLDLEADLQWTGLTILKAGSKRVEFIARYRSEGEVRSLHEDSRFCLESGRWFYIDGRYPEPGRNNPCPCGSGKKYKRCCASRP